MAFFPSSSTSTASWLSSTLFLLLLLAPCLGLAKVNANAGKSLYTNSVTYCTPPDGILVSSFAFQYYQANESGYFDLSAATVSDDLNPEATVSVDVYGLYPVNWTIAICDILDGLLCPLPVINFTGGSVLPIPTTLSSKIPSIAWSVPDLEIYLTVSFEDIDTKENIACLQASLSNGWSTRQTAVLWSTAAFALLAIGVSWFHTCWNYCRVDELIMAGEGSLGASAALAGVVTGSSSPAQWRMVDVVYFFQTIATAGMLGVDYPNVFSNFVLNFRWAVGMFHTTSVQNAINSARRKTGAKLSYVAFPEVLFVDRKSKYTQSITGSTSSSPLLEAYTVPTITSFNGLNASTSPSTLPRSISDLTLRSASSPLDSLSALRALAPRSSSVATDGTLNASTSIPNGIPLYANAIDVPTANAWMTVFFTWLFAIAVFLGIHLVAWLVLGLIVRAGEKRGGTERGEKVMVENGKTWRTARNGWWARRLLDNFHLVFLTNALRLTLIMFFPICVFALFQFTLHDAWLPIFLGAIVLAFTFLTIFLAEGSLLLAARGSHSSVDTANRQEFTEPNTYGPGTVVPSPVSHDAPSSEGTLTEPMTTPHRLVTTGRRSMFSPFPALRPMASAVYQQYRRPLHFFWLLPMLFSAFAKACFIAFGHTHGYMQIIALIVIEGLTFVLLVAFRPHTNKKGDWMSATLSLFRFVGTGLMLAFIPKFGASGIIKTVMGLVCVAVWGIGVVLLFIALWYNLFWGILWKRHTLQAPLTSQDIVAGEEAYPSQPIVMEKPPRFVGGEQDESSFMRPASSTFSNGQQYTENPIALEPVTTADRHYDARPHPSF